MTKSELIETIAARQSQLSSKDVELAVKTILEHMSHSLADGERIEIRGFGSFSHREIRASLQAWKGIARAGELGAADGPVNLPS
jgi:nucleoid DNA-binding protein